MTQHWPIAPMPRLRLPPGSSLCDCIKFGKDIRSDGQKTARDLCRDLPACQLQMFKPCIHVCTVSSSCLPPVDGCSNIRCLRPDLLLSPSAGWSNVVLCCDGADLLLSVMPKASSTATSSQTTFCSSIRTPTAPSGPLTLASPSGAVLSALAVPDATTACEPLSGLRQSAP